MSQFLNRFRRIASVPTLVRDERGLSTVEYVIILVLIAAAAVGVWSTLGATIKGKISGANTEIGDKVIMTNGDNASGKTE